jgi:hypothetical protein
MDDLRVRVDASGQLVAEGEAKKALAEHSGTYEVLTTHPDVLALVRSPIVGGQAPQPRVVMTADASGFPLSDFMAFLAQSRWTGVVRVHAPSSVRSVTLHEGEVRGATTDEPAERLGEVIIRLGMLDRATLESEAPDETPPRLGRVLVEKGLLKPHDLWKCITQQVSDIFHAIVLCREGTFVLVNQEFHERESQNLKLSTHSLLMDAIRKIDEMAHFRKRIPHGRVYPVRKRPSDGRLEPVEDKVLALADGIRNVLELGRAAQLSEFDVTKILFRLLEGGYAQVGDLPAAVPTGPNPDSPESAAGTIIGVFNAIYREIFEELKRHGREKQFVPAANAALQGHALSTSPVLERQEFQADGTLPQGPLVTRFMEVSATLGSEPLASLRQALSDVMFFLLFHAGEVLEAQADEDLARRVKELLSTLEGF